MAILGALGRVGSTRYGEVRELLPLEMLLVVSTCISAVSRSVRSRKLFMVVGESTIRSQTVGKLPAANELLEP